MTLTRSWKQTRPLTKAQPTSYFTNRDHSRTLVETFLVKGMNHGTPIFSRHLFQLLHRQVLGTGVLGLALDCLNFIFRRPNMNTVMNKGTAIGKKVLGSVPDAENLIVTSDHRWFVGGSDGFYQIDRDGLAPPQKIPIAFDAHAAPSIGNRAFFFGITQFQNFIYSTCTPDINSAASPRYIMLMDLQQSPATMVAIHQITDPAIFDGLASDAVGHLYLTNLGTFRPLRPGRIVKLNMTSPTTVASQSTWLEADGHPNGIKIDGDILYFTQEPFRLLGRSTVEKVRIKSDGTAGVPETIYTTGIARLLDDIELVEGGLVITQGGLIDEFDPATFHNSQFNKIIHISESGQELHSSDLPLSPPSAVKLVPDSVSPSPDLIVTERTGEVIRLSQGWGLRNRH